LDLSHNMITSIPNEFCLMKSLAWLDISYNNIQDLPAQFGLLSSLHTLKASHNKMSAIPTTFQYLRDLEELFLSSNEFHDFDSILCEHLPKLRVIELESNRIKHLPPEICSMSHIEELNLRHNNIQSVPLKLASYVNSSGKSLKLNLSKNPLCDLPLKLANTEHTRNYQNLSGWTEDEAYEWMNEENLIYQPAVDEWKIKKDAYLSGYLVFQDFLKGVIWRCENLTKNNMDDSDHPVTLLNGERYTNRLKRFFFHCKKHGSPPVYEKLGSDESATREKESNKLERLRQQRALNAKGAAMKRISEEHQMYLGNLSERCAKADGQMSSIEAENQRIKHMETTQLLIEVQSRVQEKDKVDAEHEIKRALETTREAKELGQNSFQTHVNKKRLLPVEITPCWN